MRITKDRPRSPGQHKVVINNIVVGCGINFGVSTQFNGGGLNGALIANNTFVNARGDSSVNNVLFEGDANYRNSSFVNNLILQAYDTSVTPATILTSLGDPDLSTFTLGNNLYSHPPSSKWPANEPGRVVADPKLVNPTMPVKGSIPDANGYTLQSNSPAINAGRAVARVTESSSVKTETESSTSARTRPAAAPRPQPAGIRRYCGHYARPVCPGVEFYRRLCRQSL